MISSSSPMCPATKRCLQSRWLSPGGAIKSSKTTVLMTGAEVLGALKKAPDVAKTYKPAR
jgi:hypothetical protein